MSGDDGMWNCAYCGKRKRKEAFPSFYAQCWQCFWEAHQAEKHPIPWSERRLIRRQARSIVKARLTADVRSTLDAIHQLDGADLLGDITE